MNHFKLATVSLLVLLNLSVTFADPVPDCLDNRGTVLKPMNQMVLDWKKNKPNQFLERALVEGTFVAVTLDRSSHYQFTIQIGKDAKKDLIEVIYNKDFGRIPEIKAGMKVSACGDFINSFAATGGFPKSPAGAIIHWVHMNPRTRPQSKDHKDGYILMNGTIVGQDNPEK